MYYVRAEQLGDTYRLVKFKFNPSGRKAAGEWKPPKVDEGTFYDAKFYDEDMRFDSSISRTRSRIRELALCNDWEWFATFTLSPEKNDRFDLAEFVKNFGYWVGNYNKKFGCKLKYIMIPEKHPTSGAWHAHGLLHDVAAASLCTNEHGYMDLPYYRERFGFISLSRIKDKQRCSNYIAKYVTKEMVETSFDLGKNKHMFYASRGLKGRACLGWAYAELETDWENDFVGIKNVTKKEMNLWLMKNVVNRDY